MATEKIEVGESKNGYSLIVAAGAFILQKKGNPIAILKSPQEIKVIQSGVEPNKYADNTLLDAKTPYIEFAYSNYHKERIYFPNETCRDEVMDIFKQIEVLDSRGELDFWRKKGSNEQYDSENND